MPISFRKLFARAFGTAADSEMIFHPTDKCPECGTRLMRVEDHWACPNLDCPIQIRAHLEHWCSPGAMDIPGAHPELVFQLTSTGLVRDVAELYRVKTAELAALPGMTSESAKSFFDAITASQKREAWRLLFGLAIPQIGEAEAQSLCRQFGSVDNVLAAGADRLRQAEGISDAAARSLVQWHSDSVNRRLVKRLFKAGLNFKA